MNLTARQSNKLEFGPVDLRPKSATGYSVEPIIPGVNFFAPMNTKLVQNKAPQFSNRQQRKDLTSLGLGSQEAIPKEFDWRNPTSVRQISKYKNLSDAQIISFINPVFNQGQCGSCWAVSSTMMLSDRHAIASRKPYVRLNIPTVLACAESAGDNGCGGGFMQNAGHYFESKGTPADCYPYNPGMRVGDSCATVEEKCGSKERYYAKQGSVREFQGDIDQIQSDIMTNGPVVAGYQVDQSFMTYKGGVFVQPQNMNTVGGHAVVIVGWGKGYAGNPDGGYWIVRNSWGEQWGERGYFRFAWNTGGDKRDPKYLENWACSWQAKVADVKEDDNKGGNDNPPGPTPPEPSPPEPTPPEPAPPGPKPSSKSLSTGAIVGISIGVLLLVVIIILLAVYLPRQRKSLLSDVYRSQLQYGLFDPRATRF